MLEKIISGGQTGVDRIAVDAAIACDFPYGGMIPAKRRSEDGFVPFSYTCFDISPYSNYMYRTEANIVNSDATLVIVIDKLSGGSKKTVELAHKLNKPCLVIRFVDGTFIGGVAPTVVCNFLKQYDVKILNIAGPRMSKIERKGAAFARMFTSCVSMYISRIIQSRSAVSNIKGFELF
jgi:hypothetical protein